MAHIDAEMLTKPEAVALARTLRQARTIEQLLTDAGVDYAVEVEEYGRSFLFGTPRHGAVFYVSSTQAAYCRTRLVDARLGKAVIDADDQGTTTGAVK